MGANDRKKKHSFASNLMEPAGGGEEQWDRGLRQPKQTAKAMQL